MEPEKRPLKVRVASVSEQGNEDDLRNSTPADRINMMWQLTLDAWAFMGDKFAESRLPRHVVHVRRREG